MRANPSKYLMMSILLLVGLTAVGHTAEPAAVATPTITVEADGKGHHVSAAGLEGAGSFLKRFVLAGSDDQPGAELFACDKERIRHEPIVRLSGGC